MYTLLSPAKKLAENRQYPSIPQISTPKLWLESCTLIKQLQGYAPHKIAELMHLSDKLALLNTERFAVMQAKPQPDDLYPSIFLFNGDAYEGLDARSLSTQELIFLDTQLGMLSGLYGLLRPSDLIYPYRLEMGTKLTNVRGHNLYDFWGDKITNYVIEQIKSSEGEAVLINLASQEYFKSIQVASIPYPIITPVFKEWRNGKLKVISFSAKRARGLMVRFIAQNHIQDPEQLKTFNTEGYEYQESLSNETEWVFTRYPIK